MTGDPATVDERPPWRRDGTVLRIGHKGADALVTGNTPESFTAAVEAGVDAIELDVLRPRADFRAGADWRRAAAGPGEAGGPLVVAHDWTDARRRDPLTLDQALDAFGRPPLDRVRLDLDLKLAGREDEVVAALRERDLVERAMVSTMELSSLEYLAAEAPELDRGWTLPKVSRDWNRTRWARPLVLAGSTSLRARLPGIIRRRAPALGVWAIWAYHPLITARLVRAAHSVEVAVIAWTVDDAPRIRALTALGADGICTNDPRLFADAGS
ncbi:MAG: glycerophosphodiester phosphodiesterase [Solirubrobacterales bacterium]